MKTIWKYPLSITDNQFVGIPSDHEILHVGVQPGGMLALWALVDPESERKTIRIHVRGTGHNATSMSKEKHLGTVFDGHFVWHVFLGA